MKLAVFTINYLKTFEIPWILHYVWYGKFQQFPLKHDAIQHLYLYLFFKTSLILFQIASHLNSSLADITSKSLRRANDAPLATMHATRTPPSSLSRETNQIINTESSVNEGLSPSDGDCGSPLPQALRSLEHLTPSLRARLESRGRLRGSLGTGKRKDRAGSGGRGVGEEVKSFCDASTVTGKDLFFFFA